jgi:hypothetical protein
MTGPQQRLPGRGNKSLAQLERDAALGRLARARRWLIVGATAATAAIAAAVSSAAPGRKLGSRATTGAARASSTASPSSAVMPALASPGQLGLQGPNEGPQPSQAPAPQASAPSPAPAPAPAPVSGGS